MKSLIYTVWFIWLSMYGVQARRQLQDELAPTNDCSCVPYYLCRDNNLSDDGSGLIDVRFDGNPCKRSVEVCCHNIDPSDTPVKIKPSGKIGCGMRNVDGIGFRIVGNFDNEAQFAEFPWMVALLEETMLYGEKHKLYNCGGTLIHEKVVLTAAHCVHQKAMDSLILRAGEWDTQITEEPLKHQDRRVVKVIIHKDYYGGALFNDIALLIAAEPFDFAGNVQIACLPKPNDVILDPSCWASGWGKNVFDKDGKYQIVLKKVKLPMVPREECLPQLRKTALGVNFKLHESFVCAGGVKGSDTCKGDGGSPLMCPVKGKPNQYQQAGIVAWGIGCGDVTPAAYANVAKLRPWVDEHMAQLNFKTAYDY